MSVVNYVFHLWMLQSDRRFDCLLHRRNIEDAVAEGPKCDGGVSNVGLVGKHDLQDSNVTDDWGRDAGDEQQNGGDEEEDHTDPDFC